jgi:MFS superfamily sulfate permease-like transporter
VSEPGLVLYRFAVGIFYANVERLVEEVSGLVDVPDGRPQWFVLVADAIDDVDYTGGKVLVELARQLEARQVVFGIAGANADLSRELEQFGVIQIIGADHVFDSAYSARAAFRGRSRR